MYIHTLFLLEVYEYIHAYNILIRASPIKTIQIVKTI